MYRYIHCMRRCLSVRNYRSIRLALFSGFRNVNFNPNTKFSNLSSEENAALKYLSKRSDVIVEAVDKGGALVARTDLY